MEQRESDRPLFWSDTCWPGVGLLTVLGIGAFGLVRFDMIVDTEYRVARVEQVQQVAGHDASERLVTVDLGDYRRALRTSDWMLRTEPGKPVCVKRSSYLLRLLVRHQLVMPGYCRLLWEPIASAPLAAGSLDE